MLRLAAFVLAATTVIVGFFVTGSRAGEAASFDAPAHRAGVVTAAVFGVDAGAFRNEWRAALSHPETVALAGLKLSVERTLRPRVVAFVKPTLDVPRVDLSPSALKYEPPRFSAFIPNQKVSDVAIGPIDDLSVGIPEHLFTPAFPANVTERLERLASAPTFKRPSLQFSVSDSSHPQFQYVPVDPGTQLAPPPDLSRTIFRNYAASRNSPVIDTSLSYSVTRTVTLSAQYDQQYLYGPYMLAPGTLGASPCCSSDDGTRRDQYGAAITYSIPDTNKAVTVQAQQTKYLDKQIPLSDATIPKLGAYLSIRF